MTYGKSENVKVPFVEVLHETDRAYLIRFEQDLTVWLPDSQVQIDGRVVEMPEWLAVEKGLENHVE